MLRAVKQLNLAIVAVPNKSSDIPYTEVSEYGMG